MSNFKSKTQLPPEETIKKRGGLPQARGYLSSKANGLFTIYADISSAPSASGLADGTPVLVRDGSDLNLYVTESGVYKQILE